MTGQRAHGRGLRIIAVYKLLKSLALLALGIGALNLLHKDVAAVAEHWINIFQVDPTVTIFGFFLRSCPLWTTSD